MIINMSAKQFLLCVILIIASSSVTYDITNNLVFPDYNTGDCVQDYETKDIYKVVKHDTNNYTIRNYLFKIDLTYDFLNNYYHKVTCPRGGRNGSYEDKYWRVK